MKLSERARFGLSIPQMFINEPVEMDRVREVVTLAEEVGFESLWLQEQIIGAGSSLEPVTLLGYVSALTSRARLGVSVIVFPLRNPFHLAKSLATLDQMSGGRLIIGLGIGSGEHEATVGFGGGRRVRRFVEGVELMRALWKDGVADYEGQIWQARGVPMEPKPRQRPHPPIWFGSRHSDALRRTARLADGWMGAGSSTIDEFRGHVKLLRRYLDEAGRDPAGFPISKRLYIAVDDRPERAEKRLRYWFNGYYGSPDNALRVSVWGSAEQCAERIAEVIDGGAGMVMLNPVYDYREQLQALAEIAGLKP